MTNSRRPASAPRLDADRAAASCGAAPSAPVSSRAGVSLVPLLALRHDPSHESEGHEMPRLFTPIRPSSMCSVRC